VDEGNPGLSIHNYYLFRMSARDLARFGLLFLRKGHWKNQQIVPKSWVRESTATYSKIGPSGGYGYMWWTGEGEGLFPNVTVREHSYYASGYRGHKVVVLPYLDLVVVHRVDTDDTDSEVELSEIGALLWLILDAAGETDLGDPPFIDAAEGVHLKGDELWAAIKGRTWQALDLGGLQATFGDDGQLSVFESGSLVEVGEWWSEGELYCHELSPALGGQWCGTFLGQDGRLAMFDLNGTLFTRLVPVDE
jgi:hypothetical protein